MMDNIFLIFGVIFIGLGTYLKVEKNYKHASKITPEIAKHLIKCKAKVLDVRTKTEYELGTVTRNNNNLAINIPGSNISDKTLEENGFNKDDIIITFCNSGTRARKAADKMIKLGYKNTFYIIETYVSLQ